MNHSGVMALMDSILAKARMTKSATDPSEPTTHPVMDVDDGTQKAQTGARDAEHKKDVRSALGESGVTGQEDAAAAGDGTVAADSIGTQKMDSSQVKGNVQTPKATKDGPAEKGRGDASPGHPSNATFQEKYSSAKLVELGNSILADLATLVKQSEETGAQEVKAPESKAPVKKASASSQGTDEEMAKKAAAAKYEEDAQEGYIAAQLLAESIMNKSAEDTRAGEMINGIVKTAQDDAVLLADFMEGLKKGASLSHKINTPQRVKRAEVPMGIPPEALMGAGGMGGAGGGEVPPEALAGAGGGIPPEALAGAGGGEGGQGGGDQEAAIEALAEALEQAGVSPEELAQVIAEQQQGGGGGEGAGGGPPPMPAAGGGEEVPAKEEREEKEGKEEKAASVKRANLVSFLRRKIKG